MSMLPAIRVCANCGRIYSFNPSVGRIACPHCGKIGPGFTMPGSDSAKLPEILRRVLRK